MNKKLIAGYCVLGAAAVSTAIFFTLHLSRSRTRDFIYESSSVTDSAQAISEAVCESSFVTSYDPLNSVTVEPCGESVSISGSFSDHVVAEASLGGDKCAPTYKDGTFTAQLSPRSLRSGRHYTLKLEFEDGYSYEVHLNYTENGFAPTEHNDILERNIKVTDNPFIIADKAVIQYISADSDPVRVRETLDEIQDISDRICDGITDDYDKLRALSEWVSLNIYYDYDASTSSVTIDTIALESVLETHRTVCLGYANLYAALCAAQGIECRVVHGTVIKGNSCFSESETEAVHEWNVAYIDGRRIWVDTLWNTTNGYISGEYMTGNQKMQYFDIPDELLSCNHRADRCDSRGYFSAAE